MLLCIFDGDHNLMSNRLFIFELFNSISFEIRSENRTQTKHTFLVPFHSEVPRYKQRIAGKSLPMEKFAIKRTERFFAQNKQLILPVVELMYLWNAFKVLGKSFQLADRVYKLIDRSLNELNTKTGPSKYDCDNRALLLLLKGACLRHMNSPLLAYK